MYVEIVQDQAHNLKVTGSNPVPATSAALRTGVDVRISELDRTYRSLGQGAAVQALSEVFALYLTDYNDVAVFVEGERLDPSALIADRKPIPLSAIVDEGQEFPAEVEVIEWKSAVER